jgi:hypothetical protein
MWWEEYDIRVDSLLKNLFYYDFQEFNIDPDCDGEQVDEFLLACLQASNSKTTTEST